MTRLVFAALVIALVGPSVRGRASAAEPADVAAGAAAAHVRLMRQERFPSAAECRNCHPNHYDEWSVSQHAYAQMSPVFNAMNGKLLKLTNGTIGDFCIRCHTPVGMSLGEPLQGSNLDRDPVSREGITCVVCHRIDRSYGKVSGRMGLVEGGLTQAVVGPSGNAELARVLDSPEQFRRVIDSETGEQLAIHAEAVQFLPISQPGFCASCHDVTLVDGLRLEEAFSEYKSSPAAVRGETCQDCHMGKVAGIASGYRSEPAAFVGGQPTRPRKRTDHRFVGPDHSVIHPALFPFNPRVSAFASITEWLTFDWQADWGNDEFEDGVTDATEFPQRWSSAFERYDARELIDQQMAALDDMAEARKKLLQVGYLLGSVEVKARKRDLRVAVEVRNGTDGHNVPTGFTAERLVWLHVVLSDADGETLFESGDLDPNGDLRDAHSLYVHNGEIERDSQLFNLQSNFVTRNMREGEREQVLAVNYAADPLPFVRPDPRPNVLNGRPAGARIHKKAIEPNGRRRHEYVIDRSLLNGRAPYRLVVELKAGMIPVNLVAEIMDVGFDYQMTPAEVASQVVAGHQVLWRRELTLGAGAEP